MPLPPGFVPPCLPTKALQPPTGALWLHEIKHDGFRVIARKDGVRVKLYSWPAMISPRALPCPPDVGPDRLNGHEFSSVTNIVIFLSSTDKHTRPTGSPSEMMAASRMTERRPTYVKPVGRLSRF
jgi:hypothetical protein